jgi:hypothetical protein
MSLEHADIIVKNHLLNYPTLFKSRLDVLIQVLFRDPDACWTADGFVVVSGIDSVNNPEVKMAKVPHLEAPLHMNDDLLKLAPDFYDVPKIERKMELMQLAFIEENIDEFAQNNFKFQDKMNLFHLDTLSSNALILNIPDYIESSWKKAALELVESTIIALSMKHKIDPDNAFTVDGWSSPRWFDTFMQFQDIRKTLAPQPTISLYDLYSSLGESVK